MLKSQLTTTTHQLAIETKLKEGNIEYAKGMLSVLLYTENSEEFAAWADYVHWAEMTATRKRFEVMENVIKSKAPVQTLSLQSRTRKQRMAWRRQS